MTLTIVADDLTGACDTGSLFAGRAPVPVDALLTATGASTAVVCPAFPAQGRAVVDRTLLIDGRPVTQTTPGRDPQFPVLPGSGRTSSVVELLRAQLDRPLAWLPLADLRRGHGDLGRRLSRLSGTVVVADAETEDDLDRLVEAALTLEPAPLLAGSAGLGRDEEQREILPAVEAARAEGLDVTGPLPAATLFSRARGGEFDIVVAMHHDQGHILVKTLGFRYDRTSGRWTGLSGVNVTVGLPFLRVSVDHGTAFDRAWKGTANHESMVEAIEVAVRMLARG